MQNAKKFKREDRYWVLKIRDVRHARKTGELSDSQAGTLYALGNLVAASRHAAGKPPLEGLFIEKDWPEYAVALQMLESRVNGHSIAQEAQDALIALRQIKHVSAMGYGTEKMQEELDRVADLLRKFCNL